MTSMKGIQNRRIKAKPKADMKRELEALSFFGRKGCFLLGVGAESGPPLFKTILLPINAATHSLATEVQGVNFLISYPIFCGLDMHWNR